MSQCAALVTASLPLAQPGTSSLSSIPYDCKVRVQPLLRPQHRPSPLTDSLLRHCDSPADILPSSPRVSLLASDLCQRALVATHPVPFPPSFLVQACVVKPPPSSKDKERGHLSYLESLPCWWGLTSLSPPAMLLSTFLTVRGINNS